MPYSSRFHGGSGSVLSDKSGRSTRKKWNVVSESAISDAKKTMVKASDSAVDEYVSSKSNKSPMLKSPVKMKKTP